MAKTSGLGDNCYIGGYDLSGDISAVALSGGPAALDVTAINKSAHERLGGLRDASWKITSFWNSAAGQEHVALSKLPTTDVIACYLRGTTLQNPAAGMVAKQVDYDPTRGNDGSLTLSVDLSSNAYGMEWGENLTAGIRTDSSATVGSAIDDTGASSYGGQAYFQVLSVTGTSVTIDIQSATTSGGSYSTTGLTTTAVTPGAAPTAQRLSVVNTTTINRYLKVVTTGTFSNAQFAVVFVRNVQAGQVF